MTPSKPANDMPNSGPITSEGLPHTASVSDGKDSSRGGPARDSGPVDVDAIEARAMDMSVGFAQLGEDHGALIWEVRRLREENSALREAGGKVYALLDGCDQGPRHPARRKNDSEWRIPWDDAAIEAFASLGPLVVTPPRKPAAAPPDVQGEAQ